MGFEEAKKREQRRSRSAFRLIQQRRQEIRRCPNQHPSRPHPPPPPQSVPSRSIPERNAYTDSTPSETKVRWYDRRPRLIINQYYRNNYSAISTKLSGTHNIKLRVTDLLPSRTPQVEMMDLGPVHCQESGNCALRILHRLSRDTATS